MSGWINVGSPGFSADGARNISLAIDFNGTLYVAYTDYGSNRKATVMKYTGTGATGWEVVGRAGFSAGATSYISLAIGFSGTPYVAYFDQNNMKVTVMKYTGNGLTGWEAVGSSSGLSGGLALFISLAIDSIGTPYVAYVDNENAKATVMKYTGIGTTGWEAVGSAGFSAGITYGTSLAIDSSGAPYVLYSDGVDRKATVMKYTGIGATGWETVGEAGFSVGAASYTSLAIDSRGILYAAYVDIANGGKATVMKYTGISATGWETVGNAGFSMGGAPYLSLAIDSIGTPYVAYKDNANSEKATVMKYTGIGAIGWEAIGNTAFSVGGVNYTSLDINSRGVPYVAYEDLGNSSGTPGKVTVMVQSCTITFDSNGGSAVPSQTIVYNGNATEPPAPIKEGNAFDEWYEDIALKSRFNFATPITEDKTLYAKWIINTYIVTFNSKGGSPVPSQIIVYNENAIEPPAPTKAASIFVGWYKDYSLTILFNFATPITTNMILYAKWISRSPIYSCIV